MAKFSPLYDVPILEAEIDVRGSIDPGSKYGLGDGDAAFESISFDLRIESPARRHKIRDLIDHAERACHMAGTIRSNVPVEFRATVNDEVLPRSNAEANQNDVDE